MSILLIDQKRLEAIQDDPDRATEANQIKRHLAQAQDDAWLALHQQTLFSDCGVKHRDCTMANYRTATPEQERFKIFIKKICGNIGQICRAGKNVLLLGPCGSGKDHAASAIAKCAIACGYSARNATGYQFQQMLADMRESKLDRSEFNEVFVDPDLLWLSDPYFSSIALTPSAASNLFGVIDTRYRTGRSTVVTCNSTDMNHMLEMIGMPSTDRLREGALVATTTWASYRGAK